MSRPNMTGPQLFDWIGNNPHEWLFCAERLLTAARVIENRRDEIGDAALARGDHSPSHPDLNTIWIPQMLTAMAIECLVKGVLLRRGKTLAKDGKLVLDEDAKAHDLVALVERVGYPRFADARQALFRLTVIALSTARYPVPMHWTMRKPELKSGWGFHEDLSWSLVFSRQCDDVINWLRTELRK